MSEFPTLQFLGGYRSSLDGDRSVHSDYRRFSITREVAELGSPTEPSRSLLPITVLITLNGRKQGADVVVDDDDDEYDYARKRRR